jgi:RHS repeat-associated protein
MTDLQTSLPVTITNPGFETGSGWSQNIMAGYPATAFDRAGWGISAPRTGSYSYAISNHPMGDIRSANYIGVTPGAQYDLYAWVKGEIDVDDSFGAWTVRINCYNSGYGYLRFLDAQTGGAGSLTTSWQQKGGRITLGTDVSYVKIVLLNYQNNGWVAFDDVELYLVQGGQRVGNNLAANPGFETSGSWSEYTGSGYPGTSFYRGSSGIAAPHGGSYAYITGNLASGYLQSNPVTVRPSSVVDLYAWVRGEIPADDSEGSWIIRAQFYDGGGNPISTADAASGAPGSLTTSWGAGPRGGQVTVPANASSLRVQLWNSMNSGWVAFDDVTVNGVVVKVTRYFYAGETAVAMRDGSGSGTYRLKWLLGDHLGSTSIIADASGVRSGEVRYRPWGEDRFTWGTTPTSYRYTGQRSEMVSFGLYFYGSRWLDPSLGRFNQPDTVVPEPGNPIAWDHYAYSANNPVKYVDPSGHWIESVLDVASIAYDAYDIATNGLNWENGLSLAADVASLALPVVTGGGVAVRALMHADDVMDAAKVINTVDNVVDTVNASDNLTDALKIVDDVPCSFNEGTIVSTLSGEQTIADVDIGEYVLGWNEANNTIGYYPVTAVLVHADPVLTELIIDGEWIETTPEHPFYTEEYGWLPADELHSGIRVYRADGKTGLVWLKWTWHHTQPMYNLTIDTAHTFFVGYRQWLVHNTCPIGTNQHHLIPQAHNDHPIVQFAQPSGWDQNGASNLMQLPNNPTTAQQLGLPQNVYNQAHRTYNVDVGVILDDLLETANQAGWTSSQAKQALFNTARQIRSRIWETRRLIAQ